MNSSYFKPRRFAVFAIGILVLAAKSFPPLVASGGGCDVDLRWYREFVTRNTERAPFIDVSRKPQSAPFAKAASSELLREQAGYPTRVFMHRSLLRPAPRGLRRAKSRL